MAGLNLRGVAAEAGVNRGLIYRYFGSRRDLLPGALCSDARRRFAEVAESAALPMRERFTLFLTMMVRHRPPVCLATLMVKVGDRSLRTMPLRTDALRVLERDVAEGHLDEVGIDAEHVAMVCLAHGFVLYRQHFSAEWESA